MSGSIVTGGGSGNERHQLDTLPISELPGCECGHRGKDDSVLDEVDHRVEGGGVLPAEVEQEGSCAAAAVAGR